MLPDKYEELVKTRGVPLLQPFGVRGSALGREDALAALDVLRGTATAVLGGDVYFQRGDKLELAYADWHCDRTPGEPPAGYAARSLEAAESYIRGFPERPGVAPLFALVVRSGGPVP